MGACLKTTLILMLAGALAGVFVAAFVVPPTLAWYTAPGGLPAGAQIPAVVQIPEVIRYATDNLIKWQTIGAVIGAVAGLVLGIGIRGRRRAKPAVTTSSAAWIVVALCAPGVWLLATSAAAAPACPADNGGLKLPAGFCALLAADGLGAARHIAVAPNGDAFVALQGTAEKGGVVALRDADGDGKFELQERFGEGSLTGIELRNGYLYVAGLNEIRRYRMTPGQLRPAAAPEIVVSGLPGVRQHGDKALTFDGQGSMYVNVGAPSNTCQVRDRQPKSPGQDPCPLLEKHAGIWKFDENTLGQTQENGTLFATGLRQMLALAWHDAALFIASNGRDSIDTLWPEQFMASDNADRPAEPLYRAVQGSTFGWPYCFYDYGQKKLLLNPEYGGDGKSVGRCSKFENPVAAYPAHWAPLDLMFYDGRQFPARYRGGAFIVFHGSWNRTPAPQRGYNVVFQPFAKGKPSGEFEVFADGFAAKDPLKTAGEAAARPDGIAQAPDGSLYVTDSVKGKIWRILYTGR